MIISKKQYENLPDHLKPYFEDFKNNHPTVKNIKLFSYLVNLGSQPNDIILDPFMGSGTTAIASKINNRQYIGFELEKEYHNICEHRIKSHERPEQTQLEAK